jgi:Tol biopolymer transport system component
LAKDPNAWPGPTEPATVVDQSQEVSRLQARQGEDGFRALYSINRSGGAAEFLMAAPGMLVSTDPQCSHDGKYIAFNSFPQIGATQDAKIYVAALDGPLKGVMRDYGYGIEPAWSPDDRRIAYAINPGNPIKANYGVWVMDVDGANRRWLTEGWFPRWSPNGKQLVCHVYSNRGSTLSLVDPSDGTARDLLAGTGWELNLYSGNWSADGKRIAFVGSFEDKDRVAIIDLEAAEDPIRILCTSDDSAVKFCGPPAWSPDGRQIVFSVADAHGQREWWKSYLYSMAVDVPSAPVLLEEKMVGNINRAMTFTADGKTVAFSSER